MRRLLQIIGIVAILFLIAAQFVGPDEHNRRIDPSQTIEAKTQMPPDVAGILKRACRDCHTSETDWQWYGRIAPTSWLQAADVYSARLHMNLSEWGKLTPAQQDDRLEGICSETRKHDMPLWYYRLMHYPSASLSDQDVKTLCDWSSAQRKLLNLPQQTRGHEQEHEH